MWWRKLWLLTLAVHAGHVYLLSVGAVGVRDWPHRKHISCGSPGCSRGSSVEKEKIRKEKHHDKDMPKISSFSWDLSFLFSKRHKKKVVDGAY